MRSRTSPRHLVELHVVRVALDLVVGPREHLFVQGLRVLVELQVVRPLPALLGHVTLVPVETFVSSVSATPPPPPLEGGALTSFQEGRILVSSPPPSLVVSCFLAVSGTNPPTRDRGEPVGGLRRFDVLPSVTESPRNGYSTRTSSNRSAPSMTCYSTASWATSQTCGSSHHDFILRPSSRSYYRL